MSVRHGLLALLEQRPMYGYQLRQEFETSTGSFWSLNIGQVYTTLARLVRDGLVSEAQADGDGDERQRSYAISDAGRAEIRDWFGTPIRHESPRRDELAIKLALAVRTPGVDPGEVIQAQRSATVRTLLDYTRAREAAGTDLSWLLIADSLIFAAEAEIRWLDHCETRLARAAQPDPATAAAAPSAPPISPDTSPAPRRTARR